MMCADSITNTKTAMIFFKLVLIFIFVIVIWPVWLGWVRLALPRSDPTTDDLKSRDEFAGGTYSY